MCQTHVNKPRYFQFFYERLCFLINRVLGGNHLSSGILECEGRSVLQHQFLNRNLTRVFIVLQFAKYGWDNSRVMFFEQILQIQG